MMKKHSARNRGLLAALAASAALALSGLLSAPGRASAESSVAECEGDACAQVTVAFDEAKGQYRVRNNSTEHWVRVSASNVAASAFACVGPGKSEDLPLRSIAGSYRADYSDQTCGTGGGE